jgi:hypothetical protein
MIDLLIIRKVIAKSIKDHLQVPVIRLNQNAAPPNYPYIGYTVTTLMKTNNGTYGEYEEEKDGESIKVYRKEFQQVWSFTAYSNDDMQSKTLAIQLYDYLDKIGSIDLSEKSIVVQKIENITNRDNLLTIDYEYRNGFDVTFAFMNEISGGNIEGIEDFHYSYNNN